MSSRASLVAIALLIAVGLVGLTSCDGFFVSPSSLKSITVTPGTAILSIASPYNTLSMIVTATAQNNTSSTVTSEATYTSANTSVVTVDSSGTLTAVGVGNTTVTVKYEGQTVKVPLLVVSAPITTINVSVSTSTLSSGTTVQATATAPDGTNITNYVGWQSATTSVATVSTSGVITGVLTGTAQITATANTADSGSLTSETATLTITVY